MTKICGAKKRDGTPCRGKPMRNGRCRLHGGATPDHRGMLNPNYKHGRFSEHMPAKIGELAYLAANDPEILDLTALIGVYAARLQVALSELETSGGYERIKAIQEKWDAFNVAWGSQDSAAVLNAKADMDRIVRAAGYDFYLWKDIDVAADNYQKLITVQFNMQQKKQTLIPVERAQEFAANLLGIVAELVTDREVLGQIMSRAADTIGAYQPVAKELAG